MTTLTETLNSALNSLWPGLLGLLLLLGALNLPKGPPSSPSAQLAFPFMQAEQKTPPRSLRWKRLYPYAPLPRRR